VNNNEALRRAFAPLGFSVSPAPNDAGLSMGGAYAAVRATRAHAQRTELLGFDVWDHADEAVHAWLRGGTDGDAAAAADAMLRGRPRPTGASTQRLAEDPDYGISHGFEWTVRECAQQRCDQRGGPRS